MKITITYQARTQDTRFYPEVRPHHKVALLPVEEPQRTGSFSTLILHNPTTEVKGFFSQTCSQEREIQTSWGCPQIWRLPSNLNPSRNLRHYRKLVKERGWQTVELNVISRRTYSKNVGFPMNIADNDFWTNLEK
jgi:hypothetical protein